MKFQFKIFKASHDDLRFEIEEDLLPVGAYLYVFEGENVLYDFLAESIDACKNLALEDFGVPLESWVFAGTIASQTDIPLLDNYLPPDLPI